MNSFTRARVLRGFWLSLIFIKLHVDAFQCTWTDPVSGNFFDLRKIQKQPPKSFVIPDDQIIYATNVCGKLTHPCPASKIQSSAIALQFAAGRCMHKLGVADNPQFSVIPEDGDNPKGGVSMEFDGGDLCDVTRKPRRVKINVICDPKAYRTKTVSANEGQGPQGVCHYEINLASVHGCATPNGISFGWIFIIVTLSVLLVLLVGAVVWNKYKNGKSGLEALPNLSFLRDLGKLAMVGCKVTSRKLIKAVDSIFKKIKENKERAKYKVVETDEDDA